MGIRVATQERKKEPANSPDTVNLLPLCFGYCIPLVQWDCNSTLSFNMLNKHDKSSKVGRHVSFFSQTSYIVDYLYP